MVKGDAARKKREIAEEFTRRYKVGDIAFCPIYGHMKILKMNPKTVVVLQVDENGKPNTNNPDRIRNQLLVEKHLFTLG